MIQVVAPLPPQIPDVTPMIFNGPDPYAAVAIVALIVGSIILFPLIRALARRVEGRSIERGAQEELDQLHERLIVLEGLETRVLELENRVEFSERLLTRQSGEDQPVSRP